MPTKQSAERGGSSADSNVGYRIETLRYIELRYMVYQQYFDKSNFDTCIDSSDTSNSDI